MSNPFYNYSGQFIPGTLGRAEAVANEYGLVAAGFAATVKQGIDSGVANAYVVTTTGAPTGAYADGTTVEFKALNANSASSTINVNGIGLATIYRFGGVPATGGDILAGVWYRLQYNTSLNSGAGGFQITAPVATTGFSGTISSAAPTFKVGLTALGGVSTAAAPIDAKWAIDQAIVPTWTGAHVFSAALTANSGMTVAGAGVVVGSPTGGDKGAGTVNATSYFLNGAAFTTRTSANPSQTIGLAVVNGAAATFMTSDSAPALSQAIVPTWTGAHTFSAVLTANLGLTVAGAGIQAGSPTGGDKGTGTLNVATGLYINGSQLFFGVPASANTTAAVADVGKCIVATGTIIIPNSVFSQGHAFSIYNNSASSITITATIATLRLAGTTTTGSRTLAARGLATIWIQSGTEGIIGGPGVT